MRKNRLRRNTTVDVLRFAMACLIAYFHVLHANILPFVTNPRYQDLSDGCLLASLVVDGFFLLGGYYLYVSHRYHPEMTWGAFARKRLLRIWPVVAFEVLFHRIVLGKGGWAMLFEIFLINANGLRLSSKGINWFISSYFWVSLLLFAILWAVEEKRARLLIAVLAWFGYVFNIQYLDGGLGRDLVLYVFHLGMLRALGGMGLGFFVGVFTHEGELWRRWLAFWEKSDQRRLVHSLLMTAAGAGLSVWLLLYYTVKGFQHENHFVTVILFTLLLLVILDGSGWISRGLARVPALGRLGQYSFAIYIMQRDALDLMKLTFWKCSGFLNAHVRLSLFLSVLFCAVVGAVVYILVEQPLLRLAGKGDLSNEAK